MPRLRYNVIVAKLDGTFDVPLEKRTPDQQWALCLLRKRNDFTLDRKSDLHCHGKKVTIKEDLPEYVKKGLKDNHGSDSRVLYYKLKEPYTGFSQRDISRILSKKEYLHEQLPCFMNKPVPKSVLPDKPGHQWQIDIINKKYLEVKYQKDIHTDTYFK